MAVQVAERVKRQSNGKRNGYARRNGQLNGTRALQRPPLQSGDRLRRAEFERRYHFYPEIKKAELIKGVVYVASPVRAELHGHPHFDAIGWLGHYSFLTPGIRGSDNATVRMDDENEPQPDALLCLDPVLGGNLRSTEDGYLEGAPELAVEIAASSASYDTSDKKDVYEQKGVQEYIIFQMYEQEISWFVLRNGTYVEIEPDEQGIIRSEIFPGLWLDSTAYWMHDMESVLKTLQAGMTTQEYHDFKQKLKEQLDTL